MTPPNATSTPAGQVLIEGDLATLLFTRHYPHPPGAVWSAITDPAQLRLWFMTKATIDGRPKGTVEMISGPAAFHWKGEILQWEPPRIYEYEWHLDPRAEMPKGEKSVVRWELTPKDGGTLLTLTHRRLTRGTALGFAPGTHAFLDRLAALLGKTTLPDWQTRYAEVKDAYPSWSP